LEEDLNHARHEAANNKGAAYILNGFIDRGEAVVDANGDIKIVSGDLVDQILGANIIESG
jgi:hypothetical protein